MDRVTSPGRTRWQDLSSHKDDIACSGNSMALWPLAGPVYQIIKVPDLLDVIHLPDHPCNTSGNAEE
jgi:hypothetical protein